MFTGAVDAALRRTGRPVCAYVYDTAAMAYQAAKVRAALPDRSVLLYAMKANGHPSVVEALASATDGLEVASASELAAAVSAGAGRVVFSGPGKTDAALAAAVAAGARVNVESLHELRRLNAAAQAAGKTVRAALRVNRSAAIPRAVLSMTGRPTPFGIAENMVPEVCAAWRAMSHVEIDGFHLHAMSNNLDAQAHAGYVTEAVEWSVRTARRHGIPLRSVNVGGGLGVDYTSGAAADLDVLARAWTALAVPAGTELVFEFGRILAADAGWYAAEVLDLKSTHGRTFAVLRGGTHHFRLPAAWGYDHPFTVLPVEAWPYPWPRPEVRDTRVDAVGELCTPRDVLARDQPVDRLRVGDVLVFARTGAYGWDISHHDFLRHDPPEFVVL
jgi:diaminopimelate decarboxylase